MNKMEKEKQIISVRNKGLFDDNKKSLGLCSGKLNCENKIIFHTRSQCREWNYFLTKEERKALTPPTPCYVSKRYHIIFCSKECKKDWKTRH